MNQNAIRPARRADLDEVLAIESRWPTTPHWTRKQFEEELDSAKSDFIVLERSGEIGGYAVVWTVLREAQIMDIAIKPELTGLKLGGMLMDRLLEAARAKRCDKATLEVSADNGAAISLYESKGFKAVGRRQKFYNDGSDAILMDRAL